MVFIGSGLGGVARLLLGGFVGQRFGDAFPWGTLLVNVIGSFALGLFAVLTAPESRFAAPTLWRQFFMIGVCGGFTTFSSFTHQTLALLQNGDWGRAGLNVLLSVALCMAGVGLGHFLGAQMSLSRG